MQNHQRDYQKCERNIFITQTKEKKGEEKKIQVIKFFSIWKGIYRSYLCLMHISLKEILGTLFAISLFATSGSSPKNYVSCILHLFYSSGRRDLLAKTISGQSISSFCSLLEAQNADGQTALHLACRRGSVELVEAILEYTQANVDVLDKDGDPPLVFALAAGSPECVRALIRRHANVRSRLREGLGPSVAHVCAYHGQPDCMRVGLLSFYVYVEKDVRLKLKCGGTNGKSSY